MLRLEQAFPTLTLGNNSGNMKGDPEGHFKVKSLKEQHSLEREGRGSEAHQTENEASYFCEDEMVGWHH